MPDSKGRPVACIDFDGVLNDYTGWKGVGKFERPVPGAPEGMAYLKQKGWILIVYTTRCEKEDIKKWLDRWGIVFDYINEVHDPPSNVTNPGKPTADVYIDDRALRFDGSWEHLINKINGGIEPWYKKRRDNQDNINHPQHYTHGNIEIIDVIEDWNLDWCLANVVKYIGRIGHKGNDIEDLKKAAWYLNRKIKTMDK